MTLPVPGLRLAGLGLGLLLLAACGPATDEAADSAAAGSTARTYRVRGVIVALPDPQTGAGQLRVRHEAIPDFVGATGEVEAMPVMTMPFPVAAGVDLSGFATGNVVRFDLTVDWETADPVAVTAVERLPAATELALD